MPDELDKKLYSRIFEKIKNGFSDIKIGETICFVKHAGSQDSEKLNDYYNYFFEKSKSMGVMEEKELIELLEKEGVWTKKDDDELFKNQQELNGLKSTLKNLLLERDKEPIQKRIDEISAGIIETQNKKSNLLKNTAEEYANRKSNERFVCDCLFKDKDLKENFYSEEEFNEISSNELNIIYKKYNDSLSDFSEKNIQQVSISPIFFNIFNLYSDDLTNFFDKHPLQLSFYQINLLNSGKMFNKIFENYEIPKEIRDNAEKILKHVEELNNKKKRAEEVSQKAQSSDGFSFAKAKAKDLENMGVDKRGTKDIHSVAKDKGGDLSMEDFMKMHKK